MNTNRRPLFGALLAGALLLSAAISSAAIMTLDWDDAPPEDGAVTYTVQKKAEGATSWTDVGTTENSIMSIDVTSSVRTLYRLKITNESGVSVYDPNIVASPPTADLNFGLKPVATSYNLRTDEAMLAEFKAAISEPDPETPSFDLVEAFLGSQDLHKTPFAPPGPSRRETLASLFLVS
jgi:hypothetical protein